MKINHDNYESILIDYLDGILTEAECAEVELFLEQNPEIADQISDFMEVVLPSDTNIIYDKKDELQIISQSNADFEKWEQNFPTLPKEHIIYPHKTKLYKFGKRQIPQWSWVAAAACFAVVVMLVRPVMENENQSSGVVSQQFGIVNQPLDVILSPSTTLRINSAKNPLTDNEPSITTKPTANNNRRNVSHTPSSSPKMASNANKGVFNTPQQSTSSQDIVESVQEIVESTSRKTTEYLAVATISPIMDFNFSDEKTIIENPENPSFEEIEHEEPLSRLEKLQTATSNFALDLLKIGIHRISRRYHERKTEVQMFLEEREIPRYFAQR